TTGPGSSPGRRRWCLAKPSASLHPLRARERGAAVTSALFHCLRDRRIPASPLSWNPSPARDLGSTTPRRLDRGAGRLGALRAEAAASLVRDQRLGGPDLQLLYRPGVSVRVGETEEGAAVPLVKDGDLAHLDALADQLLA